MIRPPTAVVLLVALAMAAGCGDDTPRVSVSVKVVSASGACGATTSPRALSSLGDARRVRLSVVRRGTALGAAPKLVCDRVVRATAGEAGFTLDTSAGDWLDLWVEVFNDTAPLRLVARGGAAGINVRPRLGPVTVLATTVGAFSCTPGPMVAARAFHSATALPNGQVLLLGGLTDRGSSGSAASGSLFLETSAELYDPRRGTFRKVSGTLPAARAFHDAVLLSSPREGPYDLLLLGGLSASSAGASSAVATAGNASSPLPVFPTSATRPASSEVVRLYPWADPPQMEVLSRSPQLKARVFHALGTADDGQTVVMGGLYAADASPLKTVNDWELLTDKGATSHTGAFPLSTARVGAVAAPIAKGKLLVVGGNLGAAKGDLKTTAAALVTVGKQPTAATAPLESGASAAMQPVAFGTLTVGASDELLLAGGLTVETGKATTVRTDRPLVRLKLVGGNLRATAVQSSGFVPVAYHAAAVLPGGDSLLTGGMPAKCPVGSICGHKGAYLWQGGSGYGLRKISDLRQPRMGHRLTVTTVGNVLVSGGLTHDGKAIRALNAAEIHGPATSDLFKRAAAKETRSCP